uniref:Uncharacterized protein n=1 Tax=Anguilla anguilla TaxID=7936 RepID=A0A0E9VN41_ANGAN
MVSSKTVHILVVLPFVEPKRMNWVFTLNFLDDICRMAILVTKALIGLPHGDLKPGLM